MESKINLYGDMLINSYISYSDIKIYYNSALIQASLITLPDSQYYEIGDHPTVALTYTVTNCDIGNYQANVYVEDNYYDQLACWEFDFTVTSNGLFLAFSYLLASILV